MIHHINGTEQQLEPHSVALIHPHDCHSFRTAKTSVVITNCAFSKTLFEESLSALPAFYREKILFPEICHHKLPAERWNILTAKTDLLHKINPFFSDNTLLFFQGFLFDVLLTLIANEQKKDAPYWLVKTCAAMQKPENFIAGLPCFIELSGKTQEHLTRSLKKFTGETPSQMVNRLRTRHAAHLLLMTNMQILDIMFECGFENTAWFNQQFRKQYNMSPREYRLHNRKLFSA